LRREEYQAVPWQNGGGITHDIVVAGEPLPQRRLSLATIDRDGPFSDLRGYDRTIVLAAGAGFTLTFADGTRVTLDRLGARCDFAGETMPDCSLLAGGVRAFNVMVQRDATRAEVEVTRRQPHVPWRERGPAYAFVIAGEIAEGAETIGQHDTLFVDVEERDLVATRESLVVRVAFIPLA
jgi:environmental stress-induced protein Ves